MRNQQLAAPQGQLALVAGQHGLQWCRIGQGALGVQQQQAPRILVLRAVQQTPEGSMSRIDGFTGDRRVGLAGHYQQPGIGQTLFG